MPAPDHPVMLTPEQIQQLSVRLADLRHNVNNYLSLIVAATELMRRKPEAAARFAKSLEQPPQKIADEVKLFSDYLQELLELTHK